MSYMQGRGGYRAKAGMGVGAVVAVVAFSMFVKPYLTGQAAMATLSSSAGAASELLSDPGFTRTATVLKERFPSEFEGIVQDIAEQAQTRDSEAIGGALGNGMEGVIASNRAHMRNAPDAAIEAWRAAYREALRDIQREEKLCFAYVTGAAIDMRRASLGRAERFDSVRAAYLSALADGRDTPGVPYSGMLDVAQLDTALRETGISAMAYEVATGARQPSARHPQFACEGEIRTYEALETLPTSQANELTRQMLGG